MAETIEQTKTRLEAFILESSPDADIAPGSVLSELVVKLSASLHNLPYNQMTELGQSKSVEAVLANPEETYSPIIDEVASNFNTSRNAGRKVTGLVKVTVSASRNYYLSAGFTFQQPNLKFDYLTTRDYSVVTKAATEALSEGELRLIPEGEMFFFVVPVEATEVGEEAVAGNVNNTQVTSFTRFALGDGFTLDNFVQGEAYGNFSSGQNRETDRELITRFKEGLANKSVVSPKSLASVLRNNFSTVKAISVVGANDPDMARDKGNVFGIATLGMADVYVRTGDSVETINATLTATCLGSGLWSATVPSTLVPGFYRVLAVSPATGAFIGTYLISSTAYGFSLNPEGRNNTLRNAADARFTRYQNCTVTFEIDGTGSETAGATREVLVTLLYLPLIGDIQDFIISDANRVACADYLVKAAVPCEVSVKLVLSRKQATDEIPLSSIKQDIFTYVNNLPFGESLMVSRLIDICHNYNIARVELPVKVEGVILIPGMANDSSISINSENELVIPERADVGVSPRTTCFFINYLKPDGVTDNIGIEVV